MTRDEPLNSQLFFFVYEVLTNEPIQRIDYSFKINDIPLPIQRGNWIGLTICHTIGEGLSADTPADSPRERTPGLNFFKK